MSTSETVDRELAAKQFEELVRKGAGARDDLSAPPAVGAREKTVRYVLGLVDYQREASLPYLVCEMGLHGHRVLEVGVGTAGLAVAMAEAGATVFGIEPELANYQAGVLRVRAHGLEGTVTLRHVPDTSNTGLESNQFSRIVCASVLQYVPKPEARAALVKEMFRLLAPNGLLYIGSTGNGLFPGSDHSTRWWSNLLVRRAAKAGHTRGVTALEVMRALRGLGATLLPDRSRPPVQIERWRRREKRLLASMYSVVNTVLCRPFEMPLGAFTPHVQFLIKKAGPPTLSE